MSNTNRGAAKKLTQAGTPALRLVPEPVHRGGTSTYVSWDEVERADAFKMGYDAVYQHPNEVGPLGPGDELVIDGNNVLFGDFNVAVRVGTKAVRNGVAVGVHTHNPDNPALSPLLALPGVMVARTHRELRTAMQRRRAAG